MLNRQEVTSDGLGSRLKIERATPESRTMTNITIPALGTAALPIDANNAVKIITNWLVRVRPSGQITCMMNTAATALINANNAVKIITNWFHPY